MPNAPRRARSPTPAKPKPTEPHPGAAVIDPEKEALALAHITATIERVASDLRDGRLTLADVEAGRLAPDLAPAPPLNARARRSLEKARAKDLAAERASRLRSILALAYDAGLAAGLSTPEGVVCGRGDVMSPGQTDWVCTPLIESPFGQDFDRHRAFVQAAMAVLAEQGVPACARLELD